jgi:hypothetical protein
MEEVGGGALHNGRKNPEQPIIEQLFIYDFGTVAGEVADGKS